MGFNRSACQVGPESEVSTVLADLPMGTQTIIGSDGSIQSNFNLLDSELLTGPTGELSISMNTKNLSVVETTTVKVPNRYESRCC